MWDTRYRPLVFTDVLGQEGSVRVLRARLAKGEGFNTSYIFAGAHGTGKTTLARILARALLCLQPREDGDPCNECEHCRACLDETMGAFTELDAASQGTAADMRRIVDQLAYDYPGVRKRIFLLDEAHRMSRDAQDVLLKPIEDNRVVILFCTTEYAKIRDTIKSRCEVYEIRKIQKEDIFARVRGILERESVSYEDDAVLTVIDYARGHVRDVLNRLETLAHLGPITMESVRERLDLTMTSVYYDVLLALGDAGRVIELVEQACDRVGPSQVATGIAEAAMNAYRQANKIHTDYSTLDRARAEQVFARFGASTVSVSRHFLGLGAHVSRVDLVCAAVAYGGEGAPTVPASRALEVPAQITVVAPPVVVAPVARDPAAASLPPAPVSVGGAVALPAAPKAPEAGSRAAVTRPWKLIPEGNVPRSRVDAAGMGGPMPKGSGAASRPNRPKLDQAPASSKVPAPSQTPAEFTATVNETLKRGCYGN